MSVSRVFTLFLLMLILLAACSPAAASPTALVNGCPVTVPSDPAFNPLPSYAGEAFEGYFWHGTAELWTALPVDGIWGGLPHNSTGYTQKLVWWSQGYSVAAEPQPDLTVSGRRLDGPAEPFTLADATNAFGSDIGEAMMLGVDFPTPGCWELTGRYRDAVLTYVVWIAP